MTGPTPLSTSASIEPPLRARPISMKSYLYGLAVVMAISLAGMMGLTLYSDFHNSLSQERARLATLSKLIANNTSVLLERNRERMIGIGKRPEVLAMDSARCGNLFADLRLMFPEFANLATVDLNGLAPCSAVPQPGGKPVSVAKAEWFQRALAEKRFIVGKPFLGPITGKMVAVLVEPVWSTENELRGFVGLPLDLERFNPRVPEGSLPEGARFGFISSDGILVWRNADQEKLIGKYVGDQTGPKLALQIRDGEAETIGTDGISRYYAFVPVPEANWVVFAGIPSQLIAHKVLWTAARNGMIAVAALSVIGVLLWFLMRRIDIAERDLLRARDAAEAANRAKSVFLANMSHELRTPMNAILGFSRLLRRDKGITEEQRETLDIINRSGEHLLTLINDVLDMAKIESGRLRLEVSAFDLGEVLRDVTDMMHVRAEENGLELSLDQSSELPRYIRSDEAKLRQVLINLISNAVKFTERGGVTVRVWVVGGDQNHLLMEVEDSGPGIGPEDQKRLFDPFVQLTESASQRGTGLGLTITRQFVQMMDGSITLESTLGKGSLFRVVLPVEPADATDVVVSADKMPGQIAGLAAGQPRYRILIAEDQQENQLLLSRLMTNLGLDVRIADNGEQCLVIFQEWPPDLVWMDWRMPVMDGIEATKRIRLLPGGQRVKIVAVTASAFKDQQQELLGAGMDDFVRKPYRVEEIYECLSRQLGLKYVYRSETAAAQVAPARPIRVLIVDDDHVSRFLTTELLGGSGFMLREAASGPEALDIFGKWQPQLILMDMRMPGMDGMETTRRLRALPGGKDVLIVALTAGALDEQRAEFIAAGGDEVAIKPVDPDKVRKLLTRYLGSHGAG